jgi:hypothetical protein
MDRNKILHDPRYLGVPSGASLNISELTVRSTQTVPYLESRLVLSPNEPKRASIWAPSPWSTIRCVQNDFCGYCTFGANRAPTLNWNLHCLQIDRNDLPFEPRHPGVPSGASKLNSKPMVRLAQTVQLPCTETNYLQKVRNKILHDPPHLGVPKGASKIVSEAMVRLVQIVDLSCTETNTISKWTETRFYMIHVT